MLTLLASRRYEENEVNALAYRGDGGRTRVQVQGVQAVQGTK